MQRIIINIIYCIIKDILSIDQKYRFIRSKI
jgi:hypothetical protein